jgi:hypothetical protein
MQTPRLPESRVPGVFSWFFSVLLLGVAMSLLYTLTYRGTFRTDDEHILAARTASLALQGNLSYPQLYGNQRVLSLMPMGEPALQIEPAQAFAAAPLFWLGLQLGIGGLHSLFLLNLLITAFSASLVAVSAHKLGHPPRAALISGLLFGCATIAWPYAETFYRDVLAMGLTGVAFLGWAMFMQHRGGWAGLLIMTISLMLGLLAKNSEAALILVFAGGVFWFETGVGGRKLRRWLLAALVTAAASFVVMLLIPDQGPLARFSLDYYRFLLGHFAAGVGPGIIPGLLGPLISPAKSIFLFSPVLLLALPAVRSRIRIQRWSAILAWSSVMSISLAQALFYRQAWASGGTWGLHFILPALPGLAVATAPSIEKALQNRGWRLAILVSLAGLSAGIQWAGTVVDWRRVFALWQAQGLQPFDAAAPWDPRLLAIPTQMRLAVDPAGWDLAWRRIASAGHVTMLIVPLLCLLLMAGLGASLAGLREICRKGSKGYLPAIGMAVLGLLIPLASLFMYGADPAVLGDNPAMLGLIDRAAAGQKPGDIVVLDSYGTTLWTAMLNRWDEHTSWFSTPFAPPGSSLSPEAGGPPQPGSAIALLDSLASRQGRIWLLASGQAPDYQSPALEAWLDSACSQLQGWTVAGSLDAELKLCTLAPLE